MAPGLASRGDAAGAVGRSARVLIVDDSLVARSILARMIEANARFSVAGSVATADAALQFLRDTQVDIILLDIEMPGLSGLAALPDLIAAARGARILVVSSSVDAGATATLQALALGAADTLVKPGTKPGSGNFSGRFGEVLAERLDRLVERGEVVALPPALPAAPCRNADAAFAIVAIGASTGGIHALSQLLRAIPTGFDVPILITQHLPGTFTSYFAAQVALLAGRPCDVAQEHLRIRSGRVVIAPGDAHLRVVRTSDGAAIRLSQAPEPSRCMPSVDPMFRSLAEAFGDRALGIVLSGMGRDGCDGAAAIVAAGGCVVAQDRTSSVVWGMPGAVADGGLASAVLPPDAIGALIASGRRPA